MPLSLYCSPVLKHFYTDFQEARGQPSRMTTSEIQRPCSPVEENAPTSTWVRSVLREWLTGDPALCGGPGSWVLKMSSPGVGVFSTLSSWSFDLLEGNFISFELSFIGVYYRHNSIKYIIRHNLRPGGAYKVTSGKIQVEIIVMGPPVTVGQASR